MPLKRYEHTFFTDLEDLIAYWRNEGTDITEIIADLEDALTAAKEEIDHD